jgi:hypothetical protein
LLSATGSSWEPVAEAVNYHPPGQVALEFHRSKAFVRGLKGPVGSGKSSSAVMELFTRGIEQKPDSQGIRRVRWLVIRNTYGELKSTTIKTVQDWLPLMSFKWDAPIVGYLDFKDQHGVRCIQEWLFISVDRPEDTGKLRSLEVTGVWLNEASEIATEILQMATQRVGRYPSKKQGGPTWSGVIWDSNPPNTDHWIYRLHEVEKPEGYEIFHQPPGLLDRGNGIYEVNEGAENLKNLPTGGSYYLRQIAGKRKEWIDVFLRGQYGVLVDGKPVYPDYHDEIHCKPTLPLKNVPIIVGLDYGRSPAAVFVQLTPRGQLRVVDELYGENMGIGVFADDILKPHIAQHYREFSLIPIGDPAGIAKESDERSAFDVLAAHGIVAAPAYTNALTGRLEAVKKYLTKLIDGQPGLVIDPKCDRLRNGFMGMYHYKRVQVGFDRVKETPEKDLYSHVHDSLQYACLHADISSVNDEGFKKPLKYPSLGIA